MDLLGIAKFPKRPKPYAIMRTTDETLFCGQDGEEFTSDFDKAYYMDSMDEALKNLTALKNLMAKEKEKEMANITEKEKKVEKVETPKLNYEKAISDAALRQAGNPKNHWKTVVKNVFGNKYRVNVYCEIESPGFVTTKKQITHSYLVTCEETNGLINVKIPNNG